MFRTGVWYKTYFKVMLIISKSSHEVQTVCIEGYQSCHLYQRHRLSVIFHISSNEFIEPCLNYKKDLHLNDIRVKCRLISCNTLLCNCDNYEESGYLIAYSLCII